MLLKPVRMCWCSLHWRTVLPPQMNPQRCRGKTEGLAELVTWAGGGMGTQGHLCFASELRSKKGPLSGNSDLVEGLLGA